MTLISTWLHLGHSNNRCSKPIGPGEMRSSIIRLWQCEQRRRSVVVKDCGDEGTMLPLYWAGALPISLSPITACSDGDGASLAQYTSTRLVNIDHYWKFRSARMAPVWGTLRPSMQEALGGKAIHAALRSLTSICSGLLDCGVESVLQVRGPELT
jgi:hypothetical protein